VNICPAKALSLKPAKGGSRPRIEIDYRACLRCYCCHEVCPENAIRLVKRIF
jgi:formate hydrogenlyase subunit 6/NADH:ubiquinone oxidoreductase subunit I